VTVTGINLDSVAEPRINITVVTAARLVNGTLLPASTSSSSQVLTADVLTTNYT